MHNKLINATENETKIYCRATYFSESDSISKGRKNFDFIKIIILIFFSSNSTWFKIP
jgi:hypothetical protein